MEMGETMKKFIIIVFVLGILALVGTGFSYYFLEDRPVNVVVGPKEVAERIIDSDDFAIKINGENFLDKSDFDFDFDFDFDSDLDFDPEEGLSGPIKSIEIQKLNGYLVLEKADREAIEISENARENISYKYSNGVLTIIDSLNPSNVNKMAKNFNDSRAVRVYSKNPQAIAFKIDKLNGATKINSRLKSLDVDKVNGSLQVKADQSFDVSIDKVNGEVSLKMEDLDCRIKVGKVNGACMISGKNMLDFLSRDPIDEVIGSGRDLIEIDKINGYLGIGK